MQTWTWQAAQRNEISHHKLITSLYYLYVYISSSFNRFYCVPTVYQVMLQMLKTEEWICVWVHGQFSSVQFSHSVVSNSLWPHEPQGQAFLSITNCWGLPKLMSIELVMPYNHLSSVVPFSSCPQSFPASGSFPVSQLLASGGQSTGVSASTSVLLMNTQDWSPLAWTSWISLQSKGLSRVFSNTIQKHQFFSAQLSL